MWQLFLLVTCQIAIFHTHLILNVSVCHQPRDEVFLSPAFKLNTLFKNPWGWALKCILTALKTGCYSEPMKSWDTWFLQETATLWWSERTWCIALNQTIQIQRLKMCSTSNIHRSKMHVPLADHCPFFLSKNNLLSSSVSLLFGKSTSPVIIIYQI